jgi:hypothetical protein
LIYLFPPLFPKSKEQICACQRVSVARPGPFHKSALRFISAKIEIDRKRHFVAAPLKPHRGQFQPGNPGGGRPLGARNRLSETMLALLNTEATEHGAAVIAEVRKTKPHVWLQCMCALLPKQLSVEKLSPLGDLSDAELDLLEEYLRGQRAQLVPELEPEDTKQNGS